MTQANDVSLYQKLGIDPHKEAVKAAWSQVVESKYPGSFVVIKDDTQHPGWEVTKHGDGSGSKSLQRLLHYLERQQFLAGQAEVVRILGRDFDDALAMNTGDIAACGFVSNIEVTDHLAVYPNDPEHINKEILQVALAQRFLELKDLYARYGINLIHFGGETADLPDQVRTWVLDVDVRATEKSERTIKGNIAPGDVIFGFRSDGQAAWEDAPNSGLMSNWLTLARKGTMDEGYTEKYPFMCDPLHGFTGRFNLSTPRGLRVSEQIISPTRQWMIVIKTLLDRLDKRNARHLLHGITQNSGGGATKITNIGSGISYVKQMPEPTRFVKLVQEETREPWKAVYAGTNAGIGLDIVGSSEGGHLEAAINETSEIVNVVTMRLGKCRPSPDDKNHVFLTTPFGDFEY